ncbi:group I truncated hemoglobin [Pseudomonas sp. Gutcm_11s]|uniref:group I truncated hemoglobin n=1 Tax=Pseudomonas sp. Gutcm_11s TaxID=3026088 RepID=UPI00236219E0|nr:group 1 truncated hemoglobin [Pseudomonas sp. Gutcm_11s]MDD0842712.1 group 1 truncated hemoglobin [Pseudomonas sp. Gutcm_11s]
MRLLPLLLALLLTACASAPLPPPKDDSLYRGLGELPGITRIVEGMLLNAARNPRITHHFDDIDIERLRDKLVEQICVEAGGPCVYTGDSMEESHKGLNIDRGDFNALVEDLIDAMDAEGVAVPVQNRLLARLAPMRGQIIER